MELALNASNESDFASYLSMISELHSGPDRARSASRGPAGSSVGSGDCEWSALEGVGEVVAGRREETRLRIRLSRSPSSSFRFSEGIFESTLRGGCEAG